jgi:hypothetical protein
MPFEIHHPNFLGCMAWASDKSLCITAHKNTNKCRHLFARHGAKCDDSPCVLGVVAFTGAILYSTAQWEGWGSPEMPLRATARCDRGHHRVQPHPSSGGGGWGSLYYHAPSQLHSRGVSSSFVDGTKIPCPIAATGACPKGPWFFFKASRI